MDIKKIVNELSKNHILDGLPNNRTESLATLFYRIMSDSKVSSIFKSFALVYAANEVLDYITLDKELIGDLEYIIKREKEYEV